MKHAEISRKLSAYLENALGTGEKEDIKRHLGSCGLCREELANLEWTLGHLKSLPAVEPPTWLKAKIMAKVHDTAASQPGLRRKLLFPLQVKLPLAAIAIVFLGVVGYYLARTVGLQVPQSVLSPAAREETTRPATAPPAARQGPGVAPASPLGSHVPPDASMVPPDLPLHLPEAQSAAPVLPSGHSLPAQPMEGTRLRPADEENVPELETAPHPVKEGKAVSSGTVQRKKRSAVALPADELEITLIVDDPAAAEEPIKKAVTRLGGRITGRAYNGGDDLLFTQIEGQKVPELIDRLRRIGTMQEWPQVPEGTSGSVELTIRW